MLCHNSEDHNCSGMKDINTATCNNHDIFFFKFSIIRYLEWSKLSFSYQTFKELYLFVIQNTDFIYVCIFVILHLTADTKEKKTFNVFSFMMVLNRS